MLSYCKHRATGVGSCCEVLSGEKQRLKRGYDFEEAETPEQAQEQKRMKRDRKKEIRLKAFVLEFYCKLILMEMSHSSLRQKEIISKEGVDLLLSLQDFHTPEH